MSYKLTTTETVRISDLPFDEYTKRQLAEISAERNWERAHNAKPAGKFLYDGEKWVPQDYKGFAVVSMLNENKGNEPLAVRLTEIQTELQYNLSPRFGFYRLPAESFHQTIANTLSTDRFKKNISDAGLESAYPSMVANAVWNIPGCDSSAPVRMRMTGLSIFGTAIGMLGVFENKNDYNRIVSFRSNFYKDEQLAQLDVKMTRPFIGHITLIYIEQNLTKNQKDHLADVINELNVTLAEEENYFYISFTGLRKYHHLAEFIKQDNYPVHSL